MFEALGSFSYRHRRVVVMVWLLLFVGGLLAGTQLGHVLKGGGFSDPHSASELAASQISQRLHQGLTTVEIIFSSPTLTARSRQFIAAEQQALARLTPAAVPGLQAVQTFANSGSSVLISRDGHSSLAVLQFSRDADQVRSEVGHIRDLIRPGTLRLAVTGDPVVRADLQTQSVRDLRVVEMYALPITLIALLFVFGSLVAAALPVVTGALAVATTLGAVWIIAQLTYMSVFVMNTATLLGLAVGIDYALFIVTRFREERVAGASVGEAVATTVQRAGRSVFFSGLAVITGMLGLIFFPFAGLASIGIGGAVVVFFSVAAALTLLPALLGMLGPRVDALRVTRLRGSHESRFWPAWSRVVLPAAPLVIVVSLALIAVVAVPVLRMKSEMPTATELPKDSSARIGYDLLEQEFNRSALSPISVLVTWRGDPSALTAAHVLALWPFGQQLAQMPGVRDVSSVVNLPGVRTLPELAGFWQRFATAPKGTSTTPANQQASAQAQAIKQLIASTTGTGGALFRVTANSDPESAAARALVQRLRALKPPTGMTIWVGGESASAEDFFSGISTTFPWVVVFVVGLTYVVLLVLLRSLALPLEAVLANACTILMSFGTIVWIFQGGRLQQLLGYSGAGATDIVVPVVMFCALFGVSMDYEVFSVTRMREQWDRDHDNRAAVAAGLVRSGRVILSAALLVVIVTASFAFTRISVTKELGVGMAVAIALDAVLVRMSLVPATMRSLGRVNWYLPRWLDRVLPRLGHG
jgi:RND superfamily putative drug exporter